MEHPVIRRTCRIRNGRPTIIDLGCLTDDGRLIAVGMEATWEVPATADEEVHHFHIYKNIRTIRHFL